MGAVITGWGAAVPDTIVTNAELAVRLDIDEDWIFGRTGILARRIAGPTERTSELATAAAHEALTVAGVESGSVDAVIVATLTPDLQMPATACAVQAELGATGAAAFDLNAGCSGFLYATSLASALVDVGQARTVVVIGADILSRITDFSDPRSAVLFGDGAGAVVVERHLGTTRLGPFLLGADGSNPELLCIPRSKGLISMQGKDVYRRAVEAMSSSIVELCTVAGSAAADIDLVVAHQANARILAAVAARTGLPETMFLSNIASYGNTSAASIPLALTEGARDGRLTDDDLVVLTAFGAGFTWGAGLVRWGRSSPQNMSRITTDSGEKNGALADA
jgi:3-oxoacyl-[acyl-carrier-protein] synthase-3